MIDSFFQLYLQYNCSTQGKSVKAEDGMNIKFKNTSRISLYNTPNGDIK